MEKERKNSWMIWAIVILAAMNISTLITILYHRNLTTVSDNENIPVITDTSPRFSGRYFRDQLGFSGEQLRIFMTLNNPFRQNVQRINHDLIRLRDMMLSEMASENCDTNRLNLLSDSIGIFHARLKRDTYRYYMDIKQICNSEQQQYKLEQMFSGMFATDGSLGQYGNRGQVNRRQRGRFINNQ